MDSSKRVLLVGAAVGVGLVVALGASWFAFGPPSAEDVASPAPSFASPSDVPSLQPVSDHVWADVPSADRPAWLQPTVEGEIPARSMEPWVWDYVDDHWNLMALEVDEASKPWATVSRRLVLVAPDGEAIKLRDLPLDPYVRVIHWDPKLGKAWLAESVDIGNGNVVQMDLRSGAITTNWADGAAPESALSADGVRNADYVTDTPDGAEVWVVRRSVLGNIDGIFLRDTSGAFVPLAATTDLEAAVASGAVNSAGSPGFEAWVTVDGGTAAVLLQWADPAAWGSGGPVLVHQARWVIVDLVSGAATVSPDFDPEWPICAAIYPSDAWSGNPLPFSVDAFCGGERLKLTPGRIQTDS